MKTLLSFGGWNAGTANPFAAGDASLMDYFPSKICVTNDGGPWFDAFARDRVTQSLLTPS